jgi:hypothetical protein
MEKENMETWQGTELTDLTKKLLQKYCEKTGEKPEDVLQKAFERFFKTEIEEPKASETLRRVKIEYETVTLRIPTKLMDWLRSMEKAEGKTAIQQLEYDIVDRSRADIEALTGQELIELFELAPIFYELLKDERFK